MSTRQRQVNSPHPARGPRARLGVLHHPRHPRLDRLRHILPRVGHVAGQRTGRDRQRPGEIDRRLFAAHAAGEVAVGRADADFGARSAGRRCRPGRPGRRAQPLGPTQAAGIERGCPRCSFRSRPSRTPRRFSRFMSACTSVLPGTTKVWILTLFPLRMLAAKIMSVILPPVQRADVGAVELHVAAVVGGVLVVRASAAWRPSAPSSPGRTRARRSTARPRRR